MIPGWVGCITLEADWELKLDVIPIQIGNIKEWKFVSNDGTLVDLDQSQQVQICMPGGDPANPGNNPFPRKNTEGTCKDIGTREQPTCERCIRNPCGPHWNCNIVRKRICFFGEEDLRLPLD